MTAGKRPRAPSPALILAILLAACAPAGDSTTGGTDAGPPSPPPASDATGAPSLDVGPLPAGFQRGMNLEPIGGFGGSIDLERLPASLDVLVDLGVDHVALIPSFFQRDFGDTEFVWRGGRGRVDSDTRSAIRLARERGLAVLLKPHLWLESRNPVDWRGDILPDADDWPLWRAAYRDAILDYARMAAEEEVAAISVGSELTALALARPDFWRRLVTDVRGAFAGRVTYAANWDRELEDIEWWDALDSIGVDAFWPLADSPDERLDPAGCRTRLETVRDRLGELADRRERPVLITEIGYRSARGAAWRPWEWHEDSPQAPDPLLQAMLYRCIARTFSPVAGSGSPPATGVGPDPEAWLTGIYFWIWDSDLSWGGPGNTDFTPRGKPAEGVLGAWFNRRSPAPPGG